MSPDDPDRPLPKLRTTTDGVGLWLEAFGWIVAGLSLLGGIVLQGQGSSFDGTDYTTAAIVLGVAGVVQGLILVGFGRAVGYMAETAGHTRWAAELLAEAVKDGRS